MIEKKYHVEFPYKVRIEGFTSVGDCLCCIALIAHKHFGHPQGLCIFEEYNCRSGYCHDASLDEDQLVAGENIKYWQYDGSSYHDEYGNFHRVGSSVEGEFNLLSHYDHSHTGDYTVLYLGKIGYDYGEELYMFRNEEDALYFCIILASYGYRKYNYIGKKEYPGLRVILEKERAEKEKNKTKLEKIKCFFAIQKRNLIHFLRTDH